MKCPRCGSPGFYPANACSVCDFPLDDKRRNDYIGGNLAGYLKSHESPEIICPLCGETVKQVSSATLSLALWQHVRTVCSEPKQHAERLSELASAHNALLADGARWQSRAEAAEEDASAMRWELTDKRGGLAEVHAVLDKAGIATAFHLTCDDPECNTQVGHRVRALVSREAEKDRQWRCFHCDEVFTDKVEAMTHFGSDEWKTPACRLALEDVRTIRELEADNEQLRLDNEHLENDSRLWHEAEADRVRRIGHVQWWQELDSREGEKLAAESREAALRTELAEERDDRESTSEALDTALKLNVAYRQEIETLKQPCTHDFADDHLPLNTLRRLEHVCLKCGYRPETK